MSIAEKLKQATIPSLFAAGASVALYYAIIDQNLSAQTYILGKEVPTWLAVSTSVFVGAEVSSILVETLVPKIPVLKDAEGMLSNIIPPVTTGLSVYGAFYLLNSDQVNMTSAVLLGAGSDIVGKYAAGSIYGR